MLKFKNGDKILFTGDSVTDAGRKRPIGEGLWEGVGTGYVRDIDTLLNVCYPESLFHIINTGTGGDTSRDLLARWQNDVVDINPDYLVVCIGFNDVWRQFDTPSVKHDHVYIDEYENNLKQFIKLAKEKTNVKEIIFMTPYYIEQNTEDLMRKKMDEYGAVMKKVGKENNITVIDLQEQFSKYLNYRHSSYIMWDRVHPGYIGSLIIAKTFLKTVGFDREVI